MGLFDALKGLLPIELIQALEGEAQRSDTDLVRSGMAEVSIDTPAATTTSQEPTFVKVNGTYSAAHLIGFTHTNGVITKTDPELRLYHLSSSITAVASQNDTYVFRVAQNGVSLARTEQRRLITGVSDTGSISVTACIELAIGDTLELQVSREGVPAADCTVQRLHFSVMALT